MFMSYFSEIFFDSKLLVFDYLDMAEFVPTLPDETPPPKYDLSKDEGDLQRYFIYKTVKEDNVDKLKGECRKCGKLISRVGRATSGMITHQENCDEEASKAYKAKSKPRKSSSAPSTPRSTRQSQQPAIDSLFKVSHFEMF